jgi:hypothetical protein
MNGPIGWGGHVPWDSTAQHRTIIVVDVAGYNSPDRTMMHQYVVHEGLYDVLEGAFAEAGIDWTACLVENTGDGAVVLLPPGYPKGKVADELPPRLLARLRRHNAMHDVRARVQLRVAFNAGEVLPSGSRPVSPAISAACRILDAAEAKSELKRSGATMAVIASDGFYRDVIAHDPAAEPGKYREIPVDVKETSSVAWLRLLGGPADGVARTVVTAADSSSETDAPAVDRTTELTRLLLDISSVADESSRRILVGRLRPEIATVVAYHPQTRLHVMELARTCLRYRGGLAELVRAVEMLEPGSKAVERLAEQVRGWPEHESR